MNFICLFLFNSLFFASCLTITINASSIHEDSSPVEFQHSNESDNQRDETKIGVSEDFIYPMFDVFDLFEILEFAKKPQMSIFVKNHIFPTKYRNYEFHIFLHNDELELQSSADMSERVIGINGNDFALDIIKEFGQSIQKLRIENFESMSDERSTLTYKYLNEYCSESLIYLYMGSIRKGMFTQFKRPFSKLEILELEIKTTNTEQIGPILAFDEFFPELKRLSLIFNEPDVDEFNVNGFIDSELPQMNRLEHLEMQFDVTNQSYIAPIQKHLGKMFDNNPQIQSIFCKTLLDDAFIQVIKKHLPNLKHLIVTRLDPEMQSVHFDHVHSLSVRSNFPSPFERISFSHLQSLDLIYYEVFANGSGRDSWTTFFKNHQNLKKVNCTLYNDDGFVDFLAELPNLNDIAIRYYLSFDLDLISGIIENNKNLMKFEYQAFIIYNRDTPDMEIYRKIFGHKWNVDYDRGYLWPTLTFERKN